ncbi:MAG TPA: hypothetical protein VM452_16695 [Caulifigura sp.]|jgi:hypothetical protein|nr:hypothetical protein [Caulifigura sp.]
MLLALMFTLARMASAAWVGAAVLFVVVAVDQTRHLSPPKSETPQPAEVVPAAGEGSGGTAELTVPQRRRLVADLALRRFDFYYQAGGVLLGVSLLSSLGLRRRYLKASRWLFVIVFLGGASALLAYDYWKVYPPLRQFTATIVAQPQDEPGPTFTALHQQSMQVNSIQLLLTLLGSLLLCLPGSRPELASVDFRES